MEGVELSRLNFRGLGASVKKRPWKNPAKEFNFHTDTPEKKNKKADLDLW